MCYETISHRHKLPVVDYEEERGGDIISFEEVGTGRKTIYSIENDDVVEVPSSDFLFKLEYCTRSDTVPMEDGRTTLLTHRKEYKKYEDVSIFMDKVEEYSGEDTKTLKFLTYRLGVRCSSAKAIDGAVAYIMYLLNVVSSTDPECISDMNMQPTDGEFTDPIINKVLKAVLPPGTKADVNRFLMPAPKIFSRANYGCLANKYNDEANLPQYIICDSPMGKEVMLYIQEGRSFFATRQNMRYAVNDEGHVLYQQFGETVLYGVLVFDMDTGAHTLICKDILMYGGEVETNKLFSERLILTKEKIIKPFNKYMNENKLRHVPWGFSFKLIQFCRKRSDLSVFSKTVVETHEGHVIRISGYSHRVRGFILVPNGMFNPYSDDYLLEWVYPECVTVKLGIKMEQPRDRPAKVPFLVCQGEVQLHEANFCEEDQARFSADVRKFKGVMNGDGEGPVCLCMYDKHTGRWRYLKYQDGDSPDSIFEIMNVLESNAGEVEIDELAFCVSDPRRCSLWQTITLSAQEDVLKSLPPMLD